MSNEPFYGVCDCDDSGLKGEWEYIASQRMWVCERCGDCVPDDEQVYDEY